MKKILSAIVAGVLVLSTVNVFAEYPEPMTLTSRLMDYGLAAPGDSPAENVFYVVGDDDRVRSFLLLDQDEEGNYLVMTEEEYGTHSFSRITGENINLPNVSDDEWEYDPEDTNSIAYWLNDDQTGFLKDGNGGKKLPASVVEHIIEADWKIENNYTDRSGLKSDQLTDAKYEEALNWINGKSGIRTVRSKLSLISVSEYKAYSEKIGAVKSRASGWAGFMTRSISSKVSSTADGTVKYTNNFYHICGSNGTQTKVRLCFDGSLDEWAQNAYAVRPIFWLDKDFFKTEKIYAALSGENVLNEVRKCSVADLCDLYNEIELMLLDIDLSKIPQADNFILTGPKAKGALNEAVYEYKSPVNAPEGETVFERYVSDSEQGNYVKTEHSKKIIFGEESFAKIAVIPVDNSGLGGKRSWSGALALGDPLSVMVNDCEITSGGAEIKSIKSAPEITAELVIKNYSTGPQNVNISIVLYDENNAVSLIDRKDLTLGGSQEVPTSVGITNVIVRENYSLAVMVQYGEDEPNKPIYYKRIK